MITKIVEMHPTKTQENSASSFARGRIKSLAFAWAGIKKFFTTENNAQVHLAASVIVIVLSVLLQISLVEAIAIVFSVAFVWVTEMINTAIERAMDFISMEESPYIKNIKDISAGAVLVSAMGALITGGIVFIPKLLSL